MPLYEYACTSCDRQFEVMQRFADDPLTICETCGGALKKLLSAPAFQFKGSGWYVTDYANKGGGDTNKGGESSSASADGADKKGSDDAKGSSDTKGSGDAKSSGDAKPAGSGKSSTTDKASAAKRSKASSD